MVQQNAATHDVSAATTSLDLTTKTPYVAPFLLNCVKSSVLQTHTNRQAGMVTSSDVVQNGDVSNGDGALGIPAAINDVCPHLLH